jgi:type II secretory pathway pseudopilin PulG
VAYGGGGEIEFGVGRKAFSLVELVVTCSIIAILCGCMNLTAASVIARFSDQSSERAVEHEARQAAAWIKSHIHRARMLRCNLTLFIPGGEHAEMIRFDDRGEADRFYFLYGESIGFRAPIGYSGLQTNYFAYMYIYQTMSPALNISILKKTKGGYLPTGWKIYVSGRGYVTLRRE